MRQASKSRRAKTGFLNEHQLSEWKGWMQLVILAYHITGASQYVSVYVIFRLLIASFLFITGYEITCDFLLANGRGSGGYGVPEIVKTLIRLNLVPILLSFVMDRSILFYYFGPLVSFWAIAVFIVLRLGVRWNGSLVFLGVKILGGYLIVSYAIQDETVISAVFLVAERLFGVRDWSSERARFILGLDPMIVWLGMAVAVLRLHIFPAASNHYRLSLSSHYSSLQQRHHHHRGSLSSSSSADMNDTSSQSTSYTLTSSPQMLPLSTSTPFFTTDNIDQNNNNNRASSPPPLVASLSSSSTSSSTHIPSLPLEQQQQKVPQMPTIQLIYSCFLCLRGNSISSLFQHTRQICSHQLLPWMSKNHLKLFGPMCALILVGYTHLLITVPSKAVYHISHPTISPLPILAYAYLRNATPLLRRSCSECWIWLGTFSLEAFALQYHMWMAMDAKGVLVVAPGAATGSVFLNFLVTTTVLLWMSEGCGVAVNGFARWFVDGSCYYGTEVVKRGGGNSLEFSPILPVSSAIASGPASHRTKVKDDSDIFDDDEDFDSIELMSSGSFINNNNNSYNLNTSSSPIYEQSSVVDTSSIQRRVSLTRLFLRMAGVGIAMFILNGI